MENQPITEGLFLGNAFELIKRIPSGSVDLVLTSPPYGIRKGKLRYSPTSTKSKKSESPKGK